MCCSLRSRAMVIQNNYDSSARCEWCGDFIGGRGRDLPRGEDGKRRLVCWENCPKEAEHAGELPA